METITSYLLFRGVAQSDTKYRDIADGNYFRAFLSPLTIRRSDTKYRDIADGNDPHPTASLV